MFTDSNSTGYIGYAISLWLVTAAVIFFLDVRTYRRTGQNKEWKVSIILGWINLAVGLILLILNQMTEWLGSR
ncbi:CLC_0170 family protein [Paenibacillus senegalensis]|uniref:CLC_0170 family protein n=1 Tax=Paenibacillus senegalensis TaxID=1465766 RepID=UPI000289183F|nr:CLC_0170 family protein [Paenibacillus senegalensis]